MSEDQTVIETGGDFAPTLPEGTGAISVSDAARAMREARAKAAEPEKPTREKDPATGRFVAKESTSQEDDAAPPQEATGEDQAIDPAEEPPLERPRSWSKDREDHWKTLDRATQEVLLEHDRIASSEVRRVQNEVADQRKAIEAERQAAEQARQRHEEAANNVLQVLNQQVAAEFSDVKSMDDVRKLAETDPFRFAQFQARQMQLQAQANEVERLNRQREQESQSKFKTWSAEQDQKFEKQFPEFADKEKVTGLRKGITDYLTKEVGVPEDALPKLWETELFRDAMFQRVVYDASRWNSGIQKAKAAIAAPKPAPQRPGASTDRRDANRESIESAATRLKSAKGSNAISAAVELLRAQRAAARR